MPMCHKIYMGNKYASFECPGESPGQTSIADIEDEIALLSATIAAATYRLLCLIGELDRRDGWADPLDSNGFRSCAHWLSWRVGLSLGTARQYVRIARALPELPHVCEAFGRGEVSYSKVRAITRLATPDNEDQWLGIARCGTASQVEKLVRLTRQANVSEENDRALEHQEGRQLITYFDSDGMLVVQGRLAPEQGALRDGREPLTLPRNRPAVSRNCRTSPWQTPAATNSAPTPWCGWPSGPWTPIRRVRLPQTGTRWCCMWTPRC